MRAEARAYTQEMCNQSIKYSGVYEYLPEECDLENSSRALERNSGDGRLLKEVNFLNI